MELEFGNIRRVGCQIEFERERKGLRDIIAEGSHNYGLGYFVSSGFRKEK